MKICVIDIGSNSVRLLKWENNCAVSKSVKITKLAEGMGEKQNILREESVNRTLDALSSFVLEGKNWGAEKIFAFGTAALRRANNSSYFVEKVRENTGVNVEIIAGEIEANLGLLGVLGKNLDGGVIDIGGASTEVIVRKNGEIIYKNSFNVGAVFLKDCCGQDMLKANEYLEGIFSELKAFNLPFYAIGGTATSLVSVLLKMAEYDSKRVNGYLLNKKDAENLCKMFYSLSIEERKFIVGLQPERAEIISCGSLILCKLFDKLSIEKIKVSESDNLEGYLIYKGLSQNE